MYVYRCCVLHDRLLIKSFIFLILWLAQDVINRDDAEWMSKKKYVTPFRSCSVSVLLKIDINEQFGIWSYDCLMLYIDIPYHTMCLFHTIRWYFFIHKFVNAIRVFVNVKRAQFVWALKKKLLCAEAPAWLKYTRNLWMKLLILVLFLRRLNLNYHVSQLQRSSLRVLCFIHDFFYNVEK